jgi:hypothetical protein
MKARLAPPFATLCLALSLVATTPALAQQFIEPVPEVLGRGSDAGSWEPYRHFTRGSHDVEVEARYRYNGAVDGHGASIPAAREFRARSANGTRVCMASHFVDVAAAGIYLQGGDAQTGWVNLRGDGDWQYVGGLWRGEPTSRRDGYTVYTIYPEFGADLEMRFRNC